MADEPVDTSVRNPATPYKAEYTFNQKYTSRRGHEFEFDDTEGAERIRLAHRTGTYFEFNPDGRLVQNIMDQETKYVKGGSTCTVDENSDHKYNGNLRVSIGKDNHVEVNGVKTETIAAELAIAVNKGASIVVLEDFYIVAKNLNFVASGDVNISADGDFAVNAKNINFKASGDTSIFSEGGVLKTQSGGNTEMKAKRIDFKSG